MSRPVHGTPGTNVPDDSGWSLVGLRLLLVQFRLQERSTVIFFVEFHVLSHSLIVLT